METKEKRKELNGSKGKEKAINGSKRNYKVLKRKNGSKNMEVKGTK
jgi:hypothetical protein